MAKGQRGARALHPLLFGAFPLLFLFRQNVWGLTPADVVLGTVAVALVVAVVVMVVRTKRTLNVLTGVLNVVAFAMLATIAVPLGAELMQSRASASTADAPLLAPSTHLRGSA